MYNKLVSPFRDLSSEDVQLFLTIVAQSRDVAASLHPESEFHVIFWDAMFRQRDFIRLLPDVLNGLRMRQVQVHLISDIIADYVGGVPNPKHELHLQDSHPNALAHRLIATYIATHILRVNEEAGHTLPVNR